MSRKDLLIVHQGALGDFVVAFPILRRLREKFRRIHALCKGGHGALAKMLNLVDGSHPLEAARFASLYTDHVDPGVKEMLADYGAILLFTWSRGLERTVVKTVGRGVAHRVSPRPGPWERMHVTRHLWRRLSESGLLGNADPGPGNGMENASLEGRSAISNASPGVLIHPGSGSPRKNWPLSNFLRVADMLRADGFSCSFLLGPAERERMDEAGFQPRASVSIHTPDDLTELAALLLSAEGYIGGDSGVSHLAGFLGAPSVCIFGPSDPGRWRPNGRAVRVVRPALDCHPCFEIASRNCRGAECLARITPGMVVGALYEIGARSG